MPTVTTYPGVFGPYTPITFTRTGTNATYFNSAGVLTSAGADVPRLDYDPSTLAAQGLLIEEARTNGIRNNTMQGAVAGTPGTAPNNWNITAAGLTTTVVGTGTSGGINYIDIRFQGTTGATFGSVYFEGTSSVAATNGQTWSLSSWVSLISGSLANVNLAYLAIDQFSSAPAYLSTLSTTVIGGSLTSSLQRFTNSPTTNNASVAFLRPYVGFSWNNGVSVDFTLRIGLPQLELGAFATSVIPTTTTALTRYADVASVNTLSPWYNATEGTLYAEGSPLVAPLTTAGVPMSFVSVNNEIALRFRPTQKGGASVTTSGVVQVDIVSTGNYTAGNNKLAFAYAVNDFASSLNGESAVVDTSGTIPTVTSMHIGSVAGVSNWTNGYLRRVTYYPTRLTNAELQAITTP